MNAVIERDEIAALVPHGGAMCLWDRVLAWDATRIQLASDGHRDPAHPLRAHGRLHAVHLCEYGAQSMAVHGGLRARGSGGVAKPGLLVALRGVTLAVDRIDTLPGALVCDAEVLVDGESGWQYAFRIAHEGLLLAEGRASVVLRPQA